MSPNSVQDKIVGCQVRPLHIAILFERGRGIQHILSCRSGMEFMEDIVNPISKILKITVL